MCARESSHHFDTLFVRACSCPLFENLLVDSGIILIKYWVSVSSKEQEKRFKVGYLIYALDE